MPPGKTRTPNRLIAAVICAALAVAGLLIAAAPPARADTTRGFTPVFTTNTTGDVLVRGNTLETCLAGSTQANGSVTCAAAQAGAAQQNNNYFMTYVDADGTSGNSTFDSSSATVTVPAGATVLYAGLSWGAVTSAGALAGYSALTGVAAPNSSQRGTVLFQTPGASGYSTVNSTTTDISGGTYQGYAEVTGAVQAAGSGSYTVANVQAGTGGGNYAGWSLAVAFSDPTMPTRNLTVFTGYNIVQSNTNPYTSPLDIPVSGFTTPATGQVKTTIGVVAYEGDKGSTGDALSVGSTALSNSLNPPNDVFNSSDTDLNVAVTDRTPNYANLLGFDVDRFDATGALANGSTSTTIHLTTTGDTYYPGLLTFATDLYASDLTATKTVTDVNGGSVNRNDVLTYSVTVANGGVDGAAATVLTDAIPPNTTYVANSLTVGGTGVTDTAGDDTGEVSAGNVTARLGSGASATAGGLLAPSATKTVTFQVKVNPSVADAATVTNTASFSSNDQTTGDGTAGASNTVISTVIVPPSLTGTQATSGEVGAAYSGGFTLNGGTGTGPYTWSISSGALPAGLAISPSTGAITGTPTGTAGPSNFTVSVVDANSRVGTRTGTITVIAGPAVAFAPAAGQLGVAYSAQPTASGGTGSYTWTISAGTLPAGLTINPSSGLISGTPSAPGTSAITVQATDSVGVTGTSAVSIVVNKTPTTISGSSPSSPVRFGNVATLNATVSAGGTGTVTFTDVPTTGAQSGTPVSLGTATLSAGSASLSTTLPAFGVNTITATYGGDGTHAASTSSTFQIEVSAYAGEVIVTEFRSSGPGGAADGYVEVTNTGPAMPLAGFVVQTSSGSVTTLPTAAGVLGTGRSYLITDSAFSLAIGTLDLSATLGTGGIEVLAPDTAATQTDAVGPATGFHLGTGLPAMTGTPTRQYAWVRTEVAGAPVNTGQNAADFQLVSTTFSLVGGVQPTLGSASPTGTADPFQQNSTLTSALLDPAVSAAVAPNRVVVPGSPTGLVVRRIITNNSGATVTAAMVRLTAISELHGAPEPGVGAQPVNIADLRAVNPAVATEPVVVTGGATVTVNNLSVDTPNNGGLGGGLNSTLAVPLPNGGLAPGASIAVAITFAVDTHGTFWFSYDVDATTGVTSGAQPAGRPGVTRAVHPELARHGGVRADTHPIRPGDAGVLR